MDEDANSDDEKSANEQQARLSQFAAENDACNLVIELLDATSIHEVVFFFGGGGAGGRGRVKGFFF